MLRTRMENLAKTADTTFKAAAALNTGMGVVRNLSAGTVGLPSAETAANIVLVDKDRQPSGLEAARTQHSDWADDFNTVKNGEFVKTVAYDAHESFYTDQYNATTVVDTAKGKYVSVGTDGKWTIAAGTVVSTYVFTGLYKEGTHTLATIAVVADGGKNS